jgi:hypothetical protein
MAEKHVKRSVIMHSKETYNTTIPSDELLVAMKELSNNELKLLLYYYSRKTGWVFHDDEVAKSIDVSVRTFRDLRNSLIKKQYLFIGKGDPDIYFIGRKQVLDWVSGEDLNDNK